MTVAEAARHFGISQEGVRQRIRRGTLHAFKVDGRVYVQTNAPHVPYGTATHTPNTPLPPPGQAGHDAALPQPADSLAAVYEQALADLRSEVAFLRAELSRALAQRATAPALPPPPDWRPGPAVIGQESRQEPQIGTAQRRRDGEAKARKQHVSPRQAVRLSLYRLLSRLLAG